jgi:hypothetical protein
MVLSGGLEQGLEQRQQPTEDLMGARKKPFPISRVQEAI